MSGHSDDGSSHRSSQNSCGELSVRAMTVRKPKVSHAADARPVRGVRGVRGRKQFRGNCDCRDPVGQSATKPASRPPQRNFPKNCPDTPDRVRLPFNGPRPDDRRRRRRPASRPSLTASTMQKLANVRNRLCPRGAGPDLLVGRHAVPHQACDRSAAGGGDHVPLCGRRGRVLRRSLLRQLQIVGFVQ